MDAFDLRRFAPPRDTTFTLSQHGDQQFKVPGDPDVDDVATMLRIEGVIRGEGDDDELGAALQEGKQLLLRLIRDRQPNVEEIRIGAQELTIVFALIVHGPSVARAVMDTITAANQREDATAAAGADEAARGDGTLDDGDGDGEAAAPLRSPRRSSARSSTSDERDAGLQAIGTA